MNVLGDGPVTTAPENGFDTARNSKVALKTEVKKPKKSRLITGDPTLDATKTISFPEIQKDDMNSARSSMANSFDPFAPAFKYTPRKGENEDGEPRVSELPPINLMRNSHEKAELENDYGNMD